MTLTERLLITLSVLCACAAPSGATEAVKAMPDIVAPGQAASLNWFFTGKRVVVSGGRFGTGLDVTGKTVVVDHPKKTTRYQFEVWYTGTAPTKESATPVEKPLHAKYSVVVTVDPQLASLQTYKDSHGWQVRYLPGWGHSCVNMPGEGSDGLVFFQQEDDALERMAIAVIPVKDETSADLMQHVISDIPNHYERAEISTPQDTLYGECAATQMTFVGDDMTHPGARTKSVVIALIRGGKGYVISVRSGASRFEARKVLLNAMLESFVPPPNSSLRSLALGR
jgi:hypothetical protein